MVGSSRWVGFLQGVNPLDAPSVSWMFPVAANVSRQPPLRVGGGGGVRLPPPWSKADARDKDEDWWCAAAGACIWMRRARARRCGVTRADADATSTVSPPESVRHSVQSGTQHT